MRGAALQSLSVLHHGFNGVGVECTGETLCFALHTLQHRNSHPFFGKFGINRQHLLCLGFGFFFGGMSGVTFLPEEFAGAQEGTCAHFPTHHVAPLVAHQGQVAIRLYPVLIGVPYNGFRCGANDQLLFKLGGGVYLNSALVGFGTQPVVGNHSSLFCKALHMLGFARKKRFGNKQREIGVLCAGFFEHLVELVLHLFPDGIAIGLDNHATTHGRLLCEVGLHDQVVIPLTVVVGTLGQVFQFFCHFLF